MEHRRFADRKVWDGLADADYAEAARELAGLPTTLDPEDETAKRLTCWC